MRTLTVVGLIVGLVAAGAVSWAQGNNPQKRLIAVGWDMPNAERLRTNLAAMEQTPLQGCSVRFVGRDSKPMWFSFSREPYAEPVVAQILQDLKAVQPKQLRDRFLLLNANPGDVDWFDDAGWKIIVDHWRTGARVAREGGLAGIMFDPEAYKDPHRAFDWSAQAQTGQHTFIQYTEKARQRGREVMAAVAGEYPEATILALFLLSIHRDAAERLDPTAALAGNAYGLLPAFVNGWLDAAPPTVTIVDGCEQASYRYNSRLDYLTGANLIRNTCQRLVAPENRYKYRAQVQVGFGVYLDAYVNPPENTWYINPGKQTPVQRLGENVANALEITDEYVWIYGEQCSWWPVPHPTADKMRWPQKLPGIERALRLAADPTGYVTGLLDEPGERKNLLVNADFGSATAAAATAPQPADWKQGTAPPGWSYWQTGASKGHPDWDRKVGHKAPGAGTLVGMKWGCLIQAVPVAPGERYAVAAWYRVQGEGSPSLNMRWQTPEGKWCAETLDVSLSTARSDGEWKLMAGAGTVPDGVGKLVLLPSVNGQRSEQDIVWWDEVTAFRLE